jgi:membrane fusion protein (multidrug efflux system)
VADLTPAYESATPTWSPDGSRLAFSREGQLWVVGADGRVEVRVIKIGQAVGNKWIVTDGLKSGESVIVEGLQKAQPGMVVKPVPFNPAGGNSAAPPASARGN